MDRFLSASSIQSINVYRRGEPRLPASRPDGTKHASSGFHAEVSIAEWEDLAGQIEDAMRFLALHKTDLELLHAFPGLEHLELDFPTQLRIGPNGVVVQTDRFPSNLLLAAGKLGIELALTIWPRPTDDHRSEGPG